MNYSRNGFGSVLLSTLLVAVVMIGCSTPTENDSVEQNSEEVKKIATGLFESFNMHDWKKYSAFYAPDAKFLDPAYGKTEVTQTPAQIIEKYAGFQTMFPDIRDDIKSMVVSGNTVVVEFVSSGTDSSGVKFTLPIITVLAVEKGKIVRDATYYDM